MILIVNNHSALLGNLKAWVGNLPHEVKEFDADWNAEDYDLVILSGGGMEPVMNHEEFYKKELSFLRSIKDDKVRVVGICLGFELIARAFGSTLEQMPHPEHGEIDVKVAENDPIFGEMEAMRVYESHRWKVHKLGKDLKVLAVSNDGIEAVRHRKLPIYGFQFHPEKVVQEKTSRTILDFLTSQ